VTLRTWLGGCAFAIAIVCAYASDTSDTSDTSDSSDSSDSTDTRDIRSRWVSAISADNTSELRELLEESFKKADSNTASNSQPLWEVGASNGKTALMVASKVGDVAFAEQLVELGSNIQARTKTDGTAFMFAVLGDRQPIAQWLVGLGANINAQGH